MAVDDRMVQFVKEALSVGRSRADTRAALSSAGWSDREITEALDLFATIDFTPPVPRPRASVTARDTFVHLLLFASLAVVASYLVTLVHAILDLALPDRVDDAWKVPYATNLIRWSIAALVVATPVFVWMTVVTRRQISGDPGRRRSPIRKWVTYLSLFAAALVFFGDAIYVIYSFLAGEATLRFLLKALTVAVVCAAIFAFYLHDVEERSDAR